MLVDKKAWYFLKDKDIFMKAIIVGISCVVVFVVTYINATHPIQESNFRFTDSFYIASVANNIVNGDGFSYWDGFAYQFLDPEITTGPTVIYPLALALSLGVDKVTALYIVPIILNVSLLFVVTCFIVIRLSIFHSVLFCVFTALFVSSFQYWQWYMPLGEVPCLLLGFLSLYLIGFYESRVWVFVAGSIWALAVLSKFMFTLTIPVVFFYYIFFSSNAYRIFIFLLGVFLVFFVFSLSLMAISDIDVGTLLSAVRGYFGYGWGYGFSGFISMASRDFLLGLVFTIKTNFFNLNEYFLYRIFLAILSWTLFFCNLYFFYKIAADYRDKYKEYLPVFFGSFILFLWYFFLGLHTQRYFFVPACMVFFSYLLLYVHFNFRTFFLVAMLFLSNVIFFNWVYFDRGGGNYFEYAKDSMRLSSYVKSNNIQEMMADPSTFVPYGDIAYFFDGKNRNYSIFSYIERHVDKKECDDSVLVSVYDFKTGERESWAYRCAQLDKTTFLKWSPEFSGGYYLVLWRDSESPEGAAYRHCPSLLYHGSYYRLYWCDRGEMSRIVFEQSGKRISIK